MTASKINQTAVGTIPLPNTFELNTHLKLLDAIVSLKNGIIDQAEEHGMEGAQAWDHFCHEGAAKFLDWSEDIEISKKTITVPPLDILMIWHSFMLNTNDYARFDKQSMRGRLAGRGIDWNDLSFKLDSNYDEILDTLASWDESVKTPRSPTPRDLSAITDFDMVAAVQRQLKFAEKMHDAQWRHKPTRDDFLESAVARYEEFFTLIAENPDVCLTPTLAIDLVCLYESYSRHMTNGRLVSHDDTVDESSLEQASLVTEKLYFEKYGVPYKPWIRGGRTDAAVAPGDPPSCSGSSD
ncbi:hypothetical protein Daus18300_011542 [Diaporthe australafricana]|uniref:Uncharacterized protein n=1 Tax=Diaporthe australafricana TaxID=127596 RepID=A0ABR3W5Z6_9PEZI